MVVLGTRPGSTTILLVYRIEGAIIEFRGFEATIFGEIELRQCTFPNNDYCFVHPIFSYFGFWYFGHFSCMIFFPFFFRLAHLALQNVNKDYVIFS